MSDLTLRKMHDLDELYRTVDETQWRELTGDADAEAFVDRLEREVGHRREEKTGISASTD